jgi:Transglutaminase-like superfamily/Coenzyme PQQ synthesis protein D (PqqD)
MPQMAIEPAPTVRYACADGLWVVLDLASEDYFVLDRVASAMWEALLESASVEEAVPRVAERWDQEAERVERDLRGFVADCRKRGWLAGDGAGARPILRRPWGHGRTWGDGRTWSGPRIAAAGRSLATTSWSLRRRGLGATYAYYAGMPGGRDGAELEPCATAFRAAENLFFSKRGTEDCLVRSLALFRFLRLRGIPAEHVIAVRRSPFLAHAWVECDGHPVLERPAFIARFTPLARLRNPRV